LNRYYKNRKGDLEMKKGRRLVKNLSGWIELFWEWLKLLNAASLEPHPLIDEFLVKKMKYLESSGLIFPYPHMIFNIIPLRERIIKNGIKRKVRLMKKKKDGFLRLSALDSLLRSILVPREILISIISKKKILQISARCAKDFIMEGRPDRLVLVKMMLQSLETD
jgi:hypothetical protein